MTIDEEMAWEDYQGFPRPTRKPYKCGCGKEFVTREIYFKHKETCRGKTKTEDKREAERDRLLNESLKNFKKENGIR